MTDYRAGSTTDSSQHPDHEEHRPPRQPSPIDELADRYFADTLALHPEEATALGHPGRETEYSDYSPAGSAEQDNLNQRLLADLAQLGPADEVDRVTAAALRERIGLERRLHATGRTELNNLASPAQEIRSIFDLMSTETEQDWAHIAGRLANLPDALAGYAASLRASRDAGHVAARRQIDVVIEQSEAHSEPGGFFPGLLERAEAAGTLPSSLMSQLDQAVRGAGEAYRSLASFLREDLREIAPERDAVGKELYQLYSQEFLGATVDLEETYAWGQEELARIIAAQQQDAERVQPGASIEQARAALNSDPARRLHGTEALRQWMQSVTDEALESMTQYFEIPAPMDRVQCMIAPTQEGGVYYTGPSEDFSRPGRMWWSVPPGEDSFTTWEQKTTVYHEGVPGHHLQIGTAMLAQDELNSWRRNALWTSGHGEGWALYAEQLMEEFGYLQDPGDHLGMLDAQRMRAARVVFDIGVHCGFEAPESEGGGVWTPEQGFAFLNKHLNDTPGQVRFEFIRYLGWPGQAPSYKVGQRIWEQIRTEHASRAAAAGEDFDLKAFHTRALRLGSMGLDTLRSALA